jgi:nucleoside-diphosphate-sugar epimerase
MPTAFLAGATGVVGRQLLPLLVSDGWRVFGTTRRPERALELEALGAVPVVVDALDEQALRAALIAAQPSVVVHQLTDLPPGLDPALMPAALVRTARLRDTGTRNLVNAALAAGARRLVAQSIAFAYADGPLPHGEQDPLAVGAEGARGLTARGVEALETCVLKANLAGIVLRFGRLYGPGTGFTQASGPAPLAVSEAARASFLAMTRGNTGVYNIAEPDGSVDIAKASLDLGWSDRPNLSKPPF